MLLYKDGNFMQALEGTEEMVHRVHATISHDPRHKGLITLLQETRADRHFAQWSMGFRDLGSAEYPEGYSDLMNAPLTGQEFQANPSKAKALLLSFRKSM